MVLCITGTIYFLLDIEIGSDNGINLAHTIRQFDKNTIIIFTTSHSECVFDVLEYVHGFYKANYRGESR